MGLFGGIQLDSLLYRIVALLLAIVVHDTVQAAAAMLLGDRTAKEQHRLTLNPVAHLSAFGLVPVLFGPFGWSNPVPVDSSRLRGRQKLRTSLIYASGLLANLALGIGLWWVTFHLPVSVEKQELIRGILQWSYITNIMFVILQLLPFYPTDVWKIVRIWLPVSWESGLNKYERLGIAVLLGLVVTPFGQWMFQNCFEWVSGVIMNMYGWSWEAGL